MKTLQFIAHCQAQQAPNDCLAAQQQVTQLLAEKLADYGFETLSQSGDHIAVSVEQHELPLAVACQIQTEQGHMVCEISSYPAEEQDWLDRITEQSLLNQLAQAVETTLKTQTHFSNFEWK
ncbi:hypothetical protein [uncultured Acinetobacter sp.]|uniref:hypothetical protein n=1 Tax=uncultured Acinetobacter sp. TaxID=165433 RepID=UPI002637AE06|nr:hypothetical protein [uncultured Acinetobacter sp.]